MVLNASEAEPARTAKKGERSTARKGSSGSGTAQPRLLAGGNPQIPKSDSDARVQAYIEAVEGWKRDVGRRLDALIVGTVPEVRKAVRCNSSFDGVAGQGWFLGSHCLTNYSKVASSSVRRI